MLQEECLPWLGLFIPERKGTAAQWVEFFKGTVSRDFLLQAFSMNHLPKPLKMTLGSFEIFLKIHRDIRKSRCTTSIKNTGGRFATGTAGVVDIRWQICQRCQ